MAVQHVAMQYLEELDSGNGIAIINKQDNYCEFVSFMGSSKDAHLLNFCINNINFLKDFISYFQYVFKKQIVLAEKHKFTLPDYEKDNKSKPPFFALQADSEYFAEKIKMFLLKKRIGSLSNREIYIIDNLAAGETAKQIGMKANISYRTVEKHIEHIKDKLNCRNTAALINTWSTIQANGKI
jgi:DNA-binding CsgD family transcriptional regulator